MKHLLFAVVALLTMSGSALAIPVIDVGIHELVPESAGQIVAILVHGGDPVSQLNFNVQVGDGGLDNGGPLITGIELVNGTIFQGNATQPQIIRATSHALSATVSTIQGTIPAEGVVAFLTFDTSAFPPGSAGVWELSLVNTVNGDTDFGGRPAAIYNGNVILQPEPAFLALLGFAALLLGRHRSA